MITLKNINKYYMSGSEKYHALKDINITFPDKGLVSIVGKSGSGKSTLLNVIGGIDNYDSGELIIDNLNTNKFSKKDYNSYRNTYIGFIFQEFNVVKNLSVYDNIALSLRLKNENIKQNNELILNTIKSVGLAGKENRKMNQLSGGERQRVAIARAIVKNPKVIIADEPTGNLDKKNRDVVMDILKEIAKEKLVIIVTHDKTLSSKYSTDEITLKDGAVIKNTLNDKTIEDNNKNMELSPIQPSISTSIFLSFKSLKQNLLRFIFIILFFTISLVFANTTINLYFSNATSEYVDYQTEYNNKYITLSQEQNLYEQSIKSGFFQIDTLNYKELINSFNIENEEGLNTTYKIYKTFKNEFKIDRYSSDEVDSKYKKSIDNIIIIENLNTFSKDYQIVDVDNYNSSKLKCYITDYVAYSLIEHNYFNEYFDLSTNPTIKQVSDYFINKTLTSPQFNYPIQIEGIIVTNFKDFDNVDLSDPKYFASFNDNLCFYNSLFFQTSTYVGNSDASEFVSTNNMNYAYDDFIYSALGKNGTITNVKVTSYQNGLNILKGKLPEKKLEDDDMEQIAISSSLLQQITGLTVEEVEINLDYSKGDIALVNPETETGANFAFYGYSRVTANFSCQVVGIIESEEPTIYFCNPNENSMYYNYLKLSFSDYDNSSKNFGGYLTVSISEDKESNINLYQSLRDNNISIDNLSYVKLQVVSEFINENLILFLGLFFALCMFSILMIFNFVVVTIKNSTKDIGIYMSLGMNGFKISFIYLFQIILVSTIAFILSSVGAIVFLNLLDNSLSIESSDLILQKFNLDLAPIDFKTFGITKTGILVALGLAYLVPLLSVIIPLFNLSRKKPIDVLKVS